MTRRARQPQPLDDIYQGETLQWTITVVDRDVGAAVNLTGATIEFQVKHATGQGDSLLLISLSTVDDNGIGLMSQFGDTLGQARITITPNDTKNVAIGTHFYDVVVVWPSGEREVVIVPSKFPLKAVVNQAP